MLRVLYTCLTTRHDIQLVILAGIVCVFTCITAINLFARARERTGSRGLLFAALAAAVFGAGVWATHFVAELAFRPGLPIAYDFDLTAASMFVAIGLAWLGTLIALQADRPVGGGIIMGLAVGAMHYTGLAALQVPAQAEWNPFYLAASIIIGTLGVASAIWLLCRRPAWHNRFYATGLLVAAICGLHFTGMAALILVPDPAIPVPNQGVSPNMLAPTVAAVTVAIIGLGMLVSVLEEHSARTAARDAERLQQNQAHLARVLRISGIGCVERDLQSGLIAWSPEARLIFGLAPDQRADTREDFYRFVHPDDRQRVEAAIRDSDLGLPSPPLEYRIVRPNGDVRVVYRENDVLLDDTDRPVRRISVFKDITEMHAARDRERELHRQLMHSQKLEALGTLAGGIAHDLNNTLVPILTLGKMVLREHSVDDPLHADIELMVRAGERARELVTQILAFSRKQEATLRPIELAAVVRETLHMLRAGLPTSIRIIERIEVVPLVIADPGGIHQVILNLVTNAAQAIGSCLGSITVALAPLNGGIKLTVIDTGAGMDQATLARVFEPFFTTKPVGEGTGLGLSVTHGVVARYGGRIDVKSTPGVGTEFTIVLPGAAMRAGDMTVAA